MTLFFSNMMVDMSVNDAEKNDNMISAEKIQKYKEMIIKDSVDEETYKEIYDLLPESYIVKKDRKMNDMEELGIHRKMTKWKLHKEKDKLLIEKLKAFAQEKKFGLGNQLAFNDHFDDIYIRTIYIVKN